MRQLTRSLSEFSQQFKCCYQLQWVRTFSSPPDSVYDVAIVGAGMVGASLACALASNPLTASLKVALLDRQAPAAAQRPLPDVPDARVSTVTPATVALLRSVGAWPDCAPPRSAQFSNMQVWDAQSPGHVRYTAADIGEEAMGYVVENSVLQSALLERLQTPGASTDLRWPETLQKLNLPAYSVEERKTQGTPLARLELGSGAALQARLVVGADGGRSRVREMAQLRTLGQEYNQRGVVATVRTSEPNDTAWQRFLPSGPLALLPVRDGFSNIVWSTTPAHAAELEAASPVAFAVAANEALTNGPAPGGSLLMAVLGPPPAGASFRTPPQVTELAGPPARSFPLTVCHAGRYVRSRVALIGDAAHAVHPLAGQGVNLGFADARVLAETLAAAVQSGTDIGDALFLEENYEKPRQAANVMMSAALDSLRLLFAAQSSPIAALRGLGLDVVNGAPPVKNFIMQYAMGLNPDDAPKHRI